MAFWKNFGFITHTAIEEILDKPEFTLEELLAEHELLQEVKAQNGRLLDLYDDKILVHSLDLLSKPEQLETLMEYIVHTKEIPPVGSAGARYPWNVVACEIFCSDSTQIVKSFFEHPILLDSILDILSKEPQTKEDESSVRDDEKDLMVAILSRILVFYLSKNPQAIAQVMMEKYNMVDTFIKHIGNKDVIEVMLKIIEENPLFISEWLKDNKLIELLVSKFDPSISSEIHENVSLTLERIIDLASDRNLASPLVEELETEETIEKILSHAFGGSDANSNSSLLYGISVIIKLLSSYSTDQECSSVYEVCVRFIDKILSFLEFGKEGTSFVETTTGPMEPFGFVRMKIIQLVITLITSTNASVRALLIQKQVFTTILDLFFHFQWNNFLHIQVHHMVRTILEGDDVVLKRTLLIEDQLVQRMIQNHENNLKEISKNPKVHRKGYLGFLIEILYLVWRLQKQDSHPELFEEVEKVTSWDTYLETHEIAFEDIEQNKRLGIMPSSQSVSDEDDFDGNDIYENYDNDRYDDLEELSDSDSDCDDSEIV